jgi:uncharacterized protein (DUF1697 family)
MTRYVALLRGIGPGDARMRNENLRGVCSDLGFTNVGAVISSGNIVFDADGGGPAEIERLLESAWPERLGFESTTILRSQVQLQALVDLRPFGDLEHGKDTYLLATFAKLPLDVGFPLPHQPGDEAFAVVAATVEELFTVSDTTAASSPDVMSWLERQFGKQITSRTWLTVRRILAKMK